MTKQKNQQQHLELSLYYHIVSKSLGWILTVRYHVYIIHPCSRRIMFILSTLAAGVYDLRSYRYELGS